MEKIFWEHLYKDCKEFGIQHSAFSRQRHWIIKKFLKVCFLLGHCHFFILSDLLLDALGGNWYFNPVCKSIKVQSIILPPKWRQCNDVSNKSYELRNDVLPMFAQLFIKLRPFRPSFLFDLPWTWLKNLLSF